MKFPFSASALLAATISLALVGFGASDAIPPVCGTEQPLIVNGRDFGHFKITERNAGMLTVVVNIAGQDLTDEEAISFPYITEVRAQTYCSMEGEGDTGHSPMTIARFHKDDYELANSFATFKIQEPECPEGWATDIKIQADIEEPGGITEFNGLFPVEGIDVKFRVQSLDRGDGETASYFDASFAVNSARGDDADAAVVDVLKDKKFDGYCVDAGTVIYKNYWYNAKAYSFLNQDWDNLGRHDIGNIDKPWKMDNVAYCINHWHEGTTYNNPNPALYPNAASSYKLSSGTMQTIIWQLVDDEVNNLGTTADLEWAKIIFDDCEANGGGFEPGCNDKIPLVVVPVYTNSDGDTARQNQYVQTTFAQLGITCHGATGMGQAEAACMPGGTGESGGDPHFKTFGNEWFGKLQTSSDQIHILPSQKHKVARYLNLSSLLPFCYPQTSMVGVIFFWLTFLILLQDLALLLKSELPLVMTTLSLKVLPSRLEKTSFRFSLMVNTCSMGWLRWRPRLCLVIILSNTHSLASTSISFPLILEGKRILILSSRSTRIWCTSPSMSRMELVLSSRKELVCLDPGSMERDLPEMESVSCLITMSMAKSGKSVTLTKSFSPLTGLLNGLFSVKCQRQ